MPHEDPASIGGGVENGVFLSVAPLSPGLTAKLKAKKLSKRKIGKVSVIILLHAVQPALANLYKCFCIHFEE